MCGTRLELTDRSICDIAIQNARPNAIVAGPYSLSYASKRRQKESLTEKLFLPRLVAIAVSGMSSTVTLTRRSSTRPNKSEVSASMKPSRRPLGQTSDKSVMIRSRGISSSRASSSARLSVRESDPQNSCRRATLCTALNMLLTSRCSASCTSNGNRGSRNTTIGPAVLLWAAISRYLHTPAEEPTEEVAG